MQGFNVYLADDPISNAGMESLFKDKVVGSSSMGFQVLDDLLRIRPTVVVLGTCLPELNGPQIIRRLCESEISTQPILICCGCHSVDFVDAIGNGLMGFISKSSSLQAVRDVVSRVASGETVLADVHAKLVGGIREAKKPNGGLSAREHEVLSLMGDGLTIKEISSRIYIAEPTVKFHARNIYAKLGVHNKGAAIRVAMRDGLLD